ncbi:hypothetical protein IF2G_10921 [Cordyceps javanica]|nr:hypothetical protein IF2G_10921 [Cordyceps javanica]
MTSCKSTHVGSLVSGVILVLSLAAASRLSRFWLYTRSSLPIFRSVVRSLCVLVGSPLRGASRRVMACSRNLFLPSSVVSHLLDRRPSSAYLNFGRNRFRPRKSWSREDTWIASTELAAQSAWMATTSETTQLSNWNCNSGVPRTTRARSVSVSNDLFGQLPQQFLSAPSNDGWAANMENTFTIPRNLASVCIIVRSNVTLIVIKLRSLPALGSSFQARSYFSTTGHSMSRFGKRFRNGSVLR